MMTTNKVRGMAEYHLAKAARKAEETVRKMMWGRKKARAFTVGRMEGGMRRSSLTLLNLVKRCHSAQVLATLQRLAMMPRTWRVLEVGLGDRPMVRTTYSTGGDREFKGKGKGKALNL